MRYLVLLLTLACGLALPALAADWPQFFGPTANGFSAEKGINKNWAQKPPAQLWKVSLSDGGYAGPAVANGRVFIVDHVGDQDIVRALDLKTGEEVWRYAYADTTSRNGGSYGFTNSTPVINAGKVYTLSHLGVLNCLDEKTGKLAWTKNIMTEFGGKLPDWRLAMSPLIDGSRIVVTPGGKDAAVAVLNKLTGEVLGKGGGSDFAGYATPLVATLHGKKQYVVFTGCSLIGVDAGTGAQLWRFPWVTGCNVNAAMPAVIGNSVLIASGYGHGGALVDISADGQATARWQRREFQAKFSSPIVADGYFYTTSEGNTLYCAEVATGEIKWQQRGFELGAMCAVDGTLIITDGRSGDVVMIKLSPDAYQELGRIKPLGGQSWVAPIVADGKLLVRNLQALVCLDLK